ncbi:hypothetical protein GCM10007877_04980 [Marinibactrum halimedae]|uniref:Uncharacterized protein n=2 Tax=Marinibactrum halimedae TaxID=1444977 RepID=A0AA37WKN7_9GAMM|nr:hypothetical protein GCM10007877_04980 [Marinibactrum halimedae]
MGLGFMMMGGRSMAEQIYDGAVDIYNEVTSNYAAGEFQQAGVAASGVVGMALTRRPVGKGLTRAEKNDIATLRKPHGEVHVKDINQARKLLDNMPELKPATQLRLTPNPGGGLANGFKDAKGTYRGDLINKSNPTGPVHPGVQNPNHANFPHFNITLPDGNKSAIIISGS